MDRTFINKILISIIIGLILVIITGTILVKTQHKNQSPEILLSQGKAVSLMEPADDSVIAYYKLDTIRIITAESMADDKASDESTGTVLVITPWLAYPAGDTVFYEELARKRGVIKGLLTSYFSARTKNQLLEETEVFIEDKLKNQINDTLSLGKISDIYFTDYIFLE